MVEIDIGSFISGMNFVLPLDTACLLDFYARRTSLILAQC